MTNLLSKIHITDTLLEETGHLLASFAEAKSSEGIVYWFGFEAGGRSVITTLIVPDADTSWGCVTTSARANADVLRRVVGTPLVLIGQAHSHPRHRVRHSDVDDRETFARFLGAVSVVVPYFARKGVNLRRCGVHRFVDGRYQLISPTKVGDHMHIIPGAIDLRSTEP
jgi:hypothetical protein